MLVILLARLLARLLVIRSDSSEKEGSAMRKKPVEIHQFDDVFDAIADTSTEANALRTKSDLLSAIKAALAGESKATLADLPPDLIADLVRGRISRFTVAELQALAAKVR